MKPLKRSVLITLTVLAACLPVLSTSPAYAAARVTVANSHGDAVIDATYSTTLTVRGSGFQSIKGGFGGVYVFFGTVKPGWRPSAGGHTGDDYLYVPDDESGNNAGFQRFVAFPGSDTAESANGGTMTADGSWSTTLIVPSAVFQAIDRRGSVRTVDCRKVTCGVITLGAHGVTNARNESFTPITVATLDDTSEATDAVDSSATSPTFESPGDATGRKARAASGEPTLEVDRLAAIPGHAMAFFASHLPAGRQVSVVLDDGAAAVGPLTVASDGTLAGVVSLPPHVESGTHALRVVGSELAVEVGFAVLAGGPEDKVESSRTPIAFAAVSAALLALALGRLVWLRRRAVRHA